MEQNRTDGIRSFGRANGSRDGAGNLPHATIVWGGSESDRNADAYLMAQAAVCSGDGEKPCFRCAHCAKSSRRSHPDIIIVDRPADARAIQVEQSRALKEDAFVLPNEAAVKVYIIHHADAMNEQAQNAILKLLEEPPESSRFILVAENPARLLPTVRSRCAERMSGHRSSLKTADVSDQANETAQAFFEALAEGGLKMCAFSFVLDKLDKTGFIEFIAAARALLEEKLRAAARHDGSVASVDGLTPAYLIKAVDVLARAKEYFDTNVGLVHIAGMICSELTDRNEDSND